MEPLVKERNHRVHYKNSEAHSFRIRTEIPDHQGDETYTHTEDDSALRAHRRGHIVGRHEAGTEEKTTGKEVEYRVGEPGRVSEPEDAGDSGHGSKDGKGDPRLDDLADKQIDESDQDRDGARLSGGSTDVREEHL